MGNRRKAIYSLLIATLLGGLLSGRALLFNLSYALGGLLLFSLLWAWGSVSWVRIIRQTRTKRAQVGRTFHETFTAANLALIPKLWLEITDSSDLPGYRASCVVSGMLPRRSVTWSAATVCSTRGEYTLGPIAIISGDPFGLFRFERHVGRTSKVVVYPAIVPIQTFSLPSGILSGGEAQRRRSHSVTTNAAGVREYAPGDSYSRIHWRSTARKNRLLVKEFELDPLADVWVFLDLSASSLVARLGQQSWANGVFVGSDGIPALSELNLPLSTEEYGVVIAASVSRYFLEKKRSLGFLTYGPNREILHPNRNLHQLNQLLEILAVVKGTSDFDLEHMLSLNSEYLARGTTLVIITADQTEGWVQQAQTLSRRGIRIIVILLDPLSFGGAVGTAETQGRLDTFHAETYVVHASDDISAVLNHSRP